MAIRVKLMKLACESAKNAIKFFIGFRSVSYLGVYFNGIAQDFMDWTRIGHNKQALPLFLVQLPDKINGPVDYGPVLFLDMIEFHFDLYFPKVPLLAVGKDFNGRRGAGGQGGGQKFLWGKAQVPAPHFQRFVGNDRIPRWGLDLDLIGFFLDTG